MDSKALEELEALDELDNESETGIEATEEVEATKEVEEEAESEVSEEGDGEPESPDPAESEDDGILFDFGTDDEPEPETPVIKQVRNAYKQAAKGKKEAERRIAELERKLEELTQPQPAETLGKEPDLEDFDYDQDKFKAALLDWNAQKQKVETEKARQREEQEALNRSYQEKVEAYETMKTKVKNEDFDIVEGVVLEKLNPNQKGMIVALSDNPARDVYYLGKHPEELKRLSEIQDPAKFIYELARLHSTGKTTMAKAKPPAPEKRVTGTAPRGKGAEATLEKLREEAARTGDRTKVIQYRKKHGL